MDKKGKFGCTGLNCHLILPSGVCTEDTRWCSSFIVLLVLSLVLREGRCDVDMWCSWVVYFIVCVCFLVCFVKGYDKTSGGKTEI